jgi:hypothetical protein
MQLADEYVGCTTGPTHKKVLVGLQDPWVQITLAGGGQRLVRNRVLLSPAGCRRRNYSGSLSHETTVVDSATPKQAQVVAGSAATTTRPASSPTRTRPQSSLQLGNRVKLDPPALLPPPAWRRPQSTQDATRRLHPAPPLERTSSHLDVQSDTETYRCTQKLCFVLCRV